MENLSEIKGEIDEEISKDEKKQIEKNKELEYDIKRMVDEMDCLMKF